jgi:hypothetical protein
MFLILDGPKNRTGCLLQHTCASNREGAICSEMVSYFPAGAGGSGVLAIWSIALPDRSAAIERWNIVQTSHTSAATDKVQQTNAEKRPTPHS